MGEKARTHLKVLVALSLPWGQMAPSIPTAPVIASLCLVHRDLSVPTKEPSPLPEM